MSHFLRSTATGTGLGIQPDVYGQVVPYKTPAVAFRWPLGGRISGSSPSISSNLLQSISYQPLWVLTKGVRSNAVILVSTSTYISTPQVQNQNEILLFGNYYRIQGPVQISMASQYPAKLTIGEPSRADNPFISQYTVSDLRGGMGLYRYRDLQAQATRYWTGHIDATWPNATTLPPFATSIARPGAQANAAIDAITELGGTLIICFGAAVWNHDGTDWSALIDTLPAAPVDTIWFNSRMFYALGSSGYSYQTSASATATDVATPTSGSFVVWDGKLYTIDASGILYSSATGNSASWTTLATIPLPNVDKIDLTVFDNGLGDPIIWAITEFGPWMYDAVNDKWFASRFKFPRYRRLTTKRTGGRVFRDNLYVHSQDRSLNKLQQGANVLLVDDVSPWRPDGMPSSFQGELKTFDADNYTLFVQMGNSASQPGISWTLFAYTGMGWHPIYVNTSPSATEPTAMAIIDNSLGYRLYFHDQTAAGGHFIRWIDLADFVENPLSSTNKTYNINGNVELPWFDASYEEQQKVAIQGRVKLTGASPTEKVQLSYGTDFSTTYTDIGLPIDTNTETVLTFGVNAVGIPFKSFRWKWTLSRGTTTTTAPKIEYVTLDFMRLPDVKRAFVVKLDCTEELHGVSIDNQINNLWNAVKSTTFGTFAYRDDAGNTRSYLVRAMRPQGAEFTAYDERGIYTLTLLEIKAN